MDDKESVYFSNLSLRKSGIPDERASLEDLAISLAIFFSKEQKTWENLNGLERINKIKMVLREKMAKKGPDIVTSIENQQEIHQYNSEERRNISEYIKEYVRWCKRNEYK